MTNTNDTQLTRNNDKSFSLKLIIEAETVSATYQKVKNNLVSNFEAKGFRKGKAPLNVVEQQIVPEKILEETAQILIPELYQQKIKEYDLKPIVQPQIKIMNPPISADKEWQIEILGCELPEIIVKDYKEAVSKANLANKDKPKETAINEILDILLKNAEVTIPPILLNAEVDYKLSRLVDQTNQAGLTVQAYLKNQNLTLEQYKKNLTDQVIKEWTLNLAIDKIANDNKIEVTHEEIDQEMEKYPKDKVDHNFLHFILLQNKTLNLLQSL